MRSESKSPGTELNRLMGAMGFPEQTGNLAGAALDQAIRNDLGIANNILEAFSQLPTSELQRTMQRGNMGSAAFCRRPQDALRHSREQSGSTFYDREQIQTFSLGAGIFSGVRIDGKFISTGEKEPMTAAQFEKKLNNDPEFRQRIEEQVGGRILTDGKVDGKITIAKRIPFEGLSRSRPLEGLIKRCFGDHSSRVRDHRLTPQNSHFNTVLKQLNESLKSTQAGKASGSGVSNSEASGGSDLSSILNDPTLSFEEKIALFLFAFMDKKQDEIAKKTEALEQQKKKREASEKQKSEESKNGGGFLKTASTIAGGVAGGIIGGPAGVGLGASIGGMAGGALENKGSGGPGGTQGTGDGEDSEQVAMKKLEQEITDMNKMFTLVDNMLKSMNDVVKQGPLAAIRG